MLRSCSLRCYLKFYLFILSERFGDEEDEESGKSVQ